MWTVNSESGRLRSVLLHSASLSHWWKIPIPGTHPLTGYSNIKQTYPLKAAIDEYGKLTKFLLDEGVKVFELNNLLSDIIEKSTISERLEIIKEFWKDGELKPNPDSLKAEHIVYGYPPQPIYNEEKDEVMVSSKQRSSIYSRDISFGTPLGHIISKMRYHGRQDQPKVAKIVYQRHSELSKHIDILYDVNDLPPEIDFSPTWIEGGDVLIADDETILCGVGQRSNLLGLNYTMENLFKIDTEEKIKTFCAVRIPGQLPCGGHLDVFLNFLDERKAIVMPYVMESELIPDFPMRKLLTKLSEKLTTLNGLKKASVQHANFTDSCMCDVYRRGDGGKLVKVSREKNLLDWLIREEKLDVDGIIMVGGEPKSKNDIYHLITVMQEGLREAANIVTIKPGLIVAYDRNIATNSNLESHGIQVRRLPSGHLDMLGGPHCMTMPLQRDLH